MPSHLISVAHLSSALTHILHLTTSLLCLVHFKCNADSQNEGQKSETLTKQGIPNLTYQPQTGKTKLSPQ